MTFTLESVLWILCGLIAYCVLNGSIVESHKNGGSQCGSHPAFQIFLIILTGRIWSLAFGPIALAMWIIAFWFSEPPAVGFTIAFPKGFWDEYFHEQP